MQENLDEEPNTADALAEAELREARNKSDEDDGYDDESSSDRPL